MDYSLLFDKLLKVTLEGSFLVLVILVVRKLMKKQMKKSFTYYIWLVLLIKILLPFGIESSISIYNLVPDKLSGESTETTFIENNKEFSNLEDKNIKNNSVDTYNNAEVLLEDNNISNENYNFKIMNIENIKRFLVILWASMAAFLILKNLITYIIFKNKISREQDDNFDMNNYLNEGKTLLNINKNIKIKVSNKVKSPILIGELKPYIVIPHNLISTLEDKEIKYIILHELSHYKRKDILIVWLSKLVEIFQFFNPIIYLGLKIMREDCEEACDEYVLSKLDKGENKTYGNTIIKVVENININNNLVGTTAMASNKKKIKDRIKSIAENKTFGFKTLLLGIVIIIVLITIGLTNKVNSKDLSVIDKSKVDSICIKVLPSPPKQKIIDKEEDINKVIKEINSIKVKDKKVDIYKGWEINISILGEDNYDISFAGEYININGIQYKTEKNEIEELRKLYENLNYEETDVLINEDNEKEKTSSKANKEFIEKVKADGYVIHPNSQTGGTILLPRNFEIVKDGEKIGELLSERNELSNKNGYDFSVYMWKVVELYSVTVENDENGVKEVIGLSYEDKLIGYWAEPVYKNKGEGATNKLLRTLTYKTVDENLTYTGLIKDLISKGLKIEEINKKTLSPKDNGYSADIYNIKINGEDAVIYEYSDDKAALSEGNLINRDSLREISYADEYIIIDRLSLPDINNIYLNGKIICLYDGDSEEINAALESNLGEVLIEQSKDQLIVSENKVILRYPASWDYYQTPDKIILGDISYQIDSREIKQYKNICEVSINHNDLIYDMRKYDEDYLNIKWISKLDTNNKEFLTQMPRQDFIRVTQVGNKYVDINKPYPELEINSEDKTIIGKKLFEEYIKMHTTNWRFLLDNDIDEEPKVVVIDSKINNVRLVKDGENIFTVDISYDVQAPNEKDGWYAGNGVIEENNWIRNKAYFIDIEKIGENQYRIISLYTG